MKLPNLTAIRQKTDGTTAFYGYDHRLKTRNGSFYDMKNMSAQLLPVMSTRRRRGYLRTLESPNGLFAHDKLCWVDGDGFYYDGVRKGTVTDDPKTFVRMGAQVLIWPDAVCYNAQADTFAALAVTRESVGTVNCKLCLIDGTDMGAYAVSASAPSNPANGAYWLDASQTPHVLRLWSETASMWQSVATVYTKISAVGIGVNLKKNDGVTISGLKDEGLNGSKYIVDRGDDYIIVVGLIDEAFDQTETVKVERTIPHMDFVCEWDNRIWGCNSATNEIYASALGDPANWSQYLGIASDSYAVTVGSSGDFTGCCTHQGRLLVFKENCIHSILGYKPQNYQLDTTECRGVMKGCEKSLRTVNETLLFKSQQDVCRFGSALPASISDNLGNTVYSRAVGGAVDSQYYVCMWDAQGCPNLFVYETEKGVWMREDESDVQDFATLGNELYMLLRNGQLWTMSGNLDSYADSDAHMEGDGEAEKAPAWMLETGDLGIDEPYSHYVRGIQLHAECDLGTTVTMEIRYDSETEWKRVFTCAPVTKRSLTIPYVPKRCRTLRIRLSGRGGFRLYSIVRKTEAGSDVYG